MQASTQRLLSTFCVAIAGAAFSLVSAAHAPPPERDVTRWTRGGNADGVASWSRSS
jgi:hypothetical protein